MTLKLGGLLAATLILGCPPATAQTIDLELLAPGDDAALQTVQAPQGEEVVIAPLPQELATYLSQEAQDWSLTPGDSLRDTLSRWSERAGYTLIWQTTRDYPIEAGVSFPVGTSYVEACRQVLRAVWRSNPGIKGTVYANQVLLITDATGGKP